MLRAATIMRIELQNRLGRIITEKPRLLDAHQSIVEVVVIILFEIKPVETSCFAVKRRIKIIKHFPRAIVHPLNFFQCMPPVGTINE